MVTGRSRLLQAAVLAAFLPKPEPEPSGGYDLKKHAELHKLSSMQIRPVPAGHEKAPKQAKTFNVEGSVLYVLDTDWPALKAALEKGRGGAGGG